MNVLMASVATVVATPQWVGDSAAVAATVVVAFVVSRVAAVVIRLMVGRVARRAVAGHDNWWRPRTWRDHDDNDELYEQRRRLRIAAAAGMLAHISTVVVWAVAIIVVFVVLDVDAAYFLSSAGFVGAGLAFGGQHKVHDYLTGLTVQFEDRYGVGDDVVVDVGWSHQLSAVVDHVGLFTTRLRSADQTVHVGNGQIVMVRNRSQEPAMAMLRINVGDDIDVAALTDVVRRTVNDADVTGAVVLGEVEPHVHDGGDVAVEVRTLRPLPPGAVVSIARRVEQRLQPGA